MAKLKYEELYQRHMQQSKRGLLYGIRYRSRLGLRTFWVNLKSGIMCVWYQING